MKCVCIGEVLDIYTKWSGSCYGSILTVDGIPGLSALSLQVYQPIARIQYVLLWISGHWLISVVFRMTVMSHNTPVTLLTKFWLVPGHAVTSIRIPRFPELRFHTRTWMQSMDTTHLDIIVMSCHFQTSRSWKFSTPDLISCLWSKSCLLFLSNSAFLCLPFM